MNLKKSDLRDGDVVEYSSGALRIVKDGKIYNESNLMNTLDKYDKNLRSSEGGRLDIVKVYRLIWKHEELTITSDEKAILRNVDSKYKYIARDYNGELYVYSEKPKKHECAWIAPSYMGSLSAIDRLFKMVKWEDEEPWKIEDLLKLPEKDEEA